MVNQDDNEFISISKVIVKGETWDTIIYQASTFPLNQVQ